MLKVIYPKVINTFTGIDKSKNTQIVGLLLSNIEEEPNVEYVIPLPLKAAKEVGQEIIRLVEEL